MQSTFMGDIAVVEDKTFTFTIPSYIYDVPVVEDFEAGLVNWHNVGGDQRDFTRQTGTTPSSLTGPTGAHAGSWYVFAETSSPAATADKYWLETTVDFVCGGDLTFYYHMYGSTTGTASVYISTDAGVSWSPALWTLTGQQQTASADPYTLVTVDLSAYVDMTCRLRLEYVRGTDFTGDTAFDAITYRTRAASFSFYDVDIAAGSWFASALHLWQWLLSQVNTAQGTSYTVALDANTRQLTFGGSPFCDVPDMTDDVGYAAGSYALTTSSALTGVFTPIWPLAGLSHGVLNLTGTASAAHDGQVYSLAGAAQETLTITVMLDRTDDSYDEYTAWVYMWHTFWLQGRYVTLYVDIADLPTTGSGLVAPGYVTQFAGGDVGKRSLHGLDRLVENKNTQDRTSSLTYRLRSNPAAWTLR